MPRDLPLGNGSMLVNFDRNYNLRDIYWPHIGEENHTLGHVCHMGVWVEGRFAWIDDGSWHRELLYQDDALVTQVTLTNSDLALTLVCNDAVDVDESLFFRRIEVTNQATHPRDVRLFFHYDWHLSETEGGNTIYYRAELNALVAYKGLVNFLMSGQVGDHFGIDDWATGYKDVNGAEGTWRDAEDGVLGRNPIVQGSVDCTLALHLPQVQPNGTALAYHWLAAGETYSVISDLNTMVRERGSQAFLDRSSAYWRLWVNKQPEDLADLPPQVVDLYKRSLLVLRTNIDDNGAIIAANDADVYLFSRDSYSYMWPRDGALVANALSHAGYSDVTRAFFRFCGRLVEKTGYLLHKYTPSGALGSSWQPWVDQNNQPQLPIQEDETALVVYSLWQYYHLFRDVEYVRPLYIPLVKAAADFMVDYREPHTRLPAPSHDLWEERRGIHTYTVAAVYAGLQAAAHFAEAFGEHDLAVKYSGAAEEIKAAAIQHLWDEELGCFARMATVAPDGTVHRDQTLDSSIAGLFVFGMLSCDDPQIQRAMQKLESTLWVKTAVGGMARYENDYYHQVTQDIKTAPGNPWFICTLWLAQYRIGKANTIDELHEALPLLLWVCDRALPSGVLAEQVHPYTDEPLSVSPLTWSHAEFIATVRWYAGKHRRFEIDALHAHTQVQPDSVTAAVDERRQKKQA
ncbi:MAG TPA: glycoside hydrolase family 15 protein [Ktedonobacterales bacterium]